MSSPLWNKSHHLAIFIFLMSAGCLSWLLHKLSIIIQYNIAHIYLDTLISWSKPLYIIEGCDSVADPCYIGGAGYGWIVLRIVSLSYRQNYVTKDNFSLTMSSWTIKVFYIYIY